MNSALVATLKNTQLSFCSILVVLQVDEPISRHPNHRGRNSRAVGAGVKHPIAKNQIHEESVSKKGGGGYEVR